MSAAKDYENTKLIYYIDISSVDHKIVSALYTNAVNQGFEDIETEEIS